tara:strand:+ start:2522 stop:3454 length:933 start_codon:yes stop_codon:yes gene_type:complete
MSVDDGDKEYPVGYGKPPAEHRFRKGQSGNPKGRPRKQNKQPETLGFRDMPLAGYLEKEAFRPLTLMENGKSIEIPASQAILRSIMVDGVKGNRLAKKQAYQLLRQEEKAVEDRVLKNFLYYEELKSEYEKVLAKYAEKGIEPPRLYPHPDDILLDRAKLKVYVLGPLNKDSATPYERGALLRDIYYAYSVLEEKTGKVSTVEIDGLTGSSWTVIAMSTEHALPPSYQRDEDATLGFYLRLQSLTKKQLRQKISNLFKQMEALPKSVEEQIEAQKRAMNAAAHINEALGMGLGDFARMHEGLHPLDHSKE